MRGDNESNNVMPQDGDCLPNGAGEHIAAHDREVDLAGRERLHPRFHVRHWHDLQAHAGMFFRQGADEGGQAFLAIAAHGSSSNLQVYREEKEPCNDGPAPDESQETGDDHQTYRPSVFRHRFAPFVSLRHGGHNVYHSMYHNTTNSDILSDR